MTPPQNDPPTPRLSAPAPAPEGDPLEPPLSDEQRELHQLCERWVDWRATRRYYAPPSAMVSVLGQLSGVRTRPVQAGGPDAPNSAELAAFHLAYTCEADKLDKRVFDLYYVHRVRPIKRAIDALGISRTTFYRVLSDFRARVAHAAKRIEADNLAAGQALPHAHLVEWPRDERGLAIDVKVAE